MKNKDIIIYCAGDYGKRVFYQLKEKGYNIVGFCDSSSNRIGENLLDTPIYSYKKARDKFPNASYVIANSIYEYSLEIGKMLEKDGYIKDESYYIFTELVGRGVLKRNYLIQDDSELKHSQVNTNKIKNINNILFFKSSQLSGMSLIDTMLDAHPNILFLGMNKFAANIRAIVKHASSLGTEKIVPQIMTMLREYVADDFMWDVIEVDNYETEWIEKFENILNTYIDIKQKYSEKDIFLMIHWAYYETFHGKYDDEIEPMIFMDVHVEVDEHDIVLQWLEDMGFQITLLEAIRNPYLRLGALFKYVIGENHWISERQVFYSLELYAHEYFSEIERRYKVIRYRFEDLKLHPKEIIGKIAEYMNIPWHESLMETTVNGKKSSYVSNGEYSTGLNIKPVYYPYDEYFDGFDKFRLDVLFREKSKSYGYSYTDASKYSQNIEEMGKLFCIPFKFEQYMKFSSDIEKENFYQKLECLCTGLLVMQDKKDTYKENFQFGTYLKVQ